MTAGIEAATLELGTAFVRALIEQDWRAVEACFDPSVRFRAVVPNESNPFREYGTAGDAAAQIRRWFGDADVMRLIESGSEAMVDRISIWYRVQVHEPDGWSLVEQQLYATPGPNGFRAVNLACSGFRPIHAP